MASGRCFEAWIQVILETGSVFMVDEGELLSWMWWGGEVGWIRLEERLCSLGWEQG